MYNTVSTVCAQYLSVWDQTPAFVEAHTSFTEKLSLLKEQALIQESAVTGVAKNKADTLDKVVALALVAGKTLSALALKIGDIELLGRNLHSKTEWFRGNAMLRVTRLNSLLADVNEHSASLSDFGLDQAFIDHLHAMVSSYSAMVQKPRLAILERKRATAAMDRVVSEIDALLTGQLDRIMEVFRAENPGFIAKYFDARHIVDFNGKRRDKGSSDDGHGFSNEGGYEE